MPLDKISFNPVINHHRSFVDWRDIVMQKVDSDNGTDVPMLFFSRSGAPVKFYEVFPRKQEPHIAVFAPSGAGMAFPSVCLDELWSLVQQIDVTNQGQIDLLKNSYPGQGIGPMVLGFLLEKIKDGEITDPKMIPIEYRHLLMNLLKKNSLMSEIEGLHRINIFKSE